MTPSAKFADLLLPGVSMFEQDNITTPWSQGDFISFSQKLMEPLGECRFEYDWLAETARRLGLYDVFTDGRPTAEAWLADIYADLRCRAPELPPYADFRTMGTYRYQKRIEKVAFEAQIQKGAPFPTPSGKIELCSPALAARNDPKIPALPIYVPAAEGFGGSVEFPLQLVGWHPLHRCHTVHGNNPALRDAFPQRLWMHPSDAAARAIADGDTVRVFNARGTIRIPVHVTEDIALGVTALAAGAWYEPDEAGVDTGGSINVLTGHIPTALAHGNPQHTILVQVQRE